MFRKVNVDYRKKTKNQKIKNKRKMIGTMILDYWTNFVITYLFFIYCYFQNN